MKYLSNAFLVLALFIVSCNKDTSNPTDNSNAKQWIELGQNSSIKFNNTIRNICTDNQNNLYAIGDFKDANGKYYVAKWNGSSWSQLGNSSSNSINLGPLKIVADKIGNIYVARFGSFVSKWNGTSWVELGATNNTLINRYNIRDIAIDSSNNLYAFSGYFNTNTQQEILCVSKWNNNTWNILDSGNALLKNTSGGFQGGYYFSVNTVGNIFIIPDSKNLVKWTGNSWVSYQLDSVATNANISLFQHASCFDSNNNLYFSVYKRVIKWNGTQFSTVGGYNNFVDWVTCISDTKGVIYAGSSTYDISKLNGNNWERIAIIPSSNGAGIHTLCLDNSGNLYAAGYFTNSVGNYFVAMYK